MSPLIRISNPKMAGLIGSDVQLIQVRGIHDVFRSNRIPRSLDRRPRLSSLPPAMASPYAEHRDRLDGLLDDPLEPCPHCQLHILIPS